MPDETPDEDLVARARGGDASAFEQLVRRHHRRVYGLCAGMLRNPTDAQDATQETFLAAWRRLDGFRGDASFPSWLHRIATNACLMRLRTRRRRPEAPLEIHPPGQDAEGQERPVEDFSPRLDALLESRELGQVIARSMDALPDAYRAVFVLADLQQLPMKDIAETLDLTVPNVKTRLHRARLKLRELLADYLAAEPTLARS